MADDVSCRQNSTLCFTVNQSVIYPCRCDAFLQCTPAGWVLQSCPLGTVYYPDQELDPCVMGTLLPFDCDPETPWVRCPEDESRYTDEQLQQFCESSNTTSPPPANSTTTTTKTTTTTTTAVNGDSSTSSSSDQTKVIIGGVVGGAALVVFVAVVVLYWYRRKRRGKPAEHERQGSPSEATGDHVNTHLGTDPGTAESFPNLREYSSVDRTDLMPTPYQPLVVNPNPKQNEMVTVYDLPSQGVATALKKQVHQAQRSDLGYFTPLAEAGTQDQIDDLGYITPVAESRNQGQATLMADARRDTSEPMGRRDESYGNIPLVPASEKNAKSDGSTKKDDWYTEIPSAVVPAEYCPVEKDQATDDGYLEPLKVTVPRSRDYSAQRDRYDEQNELYINTTPDAPASKNGEDCFAEQDQKTSDTYLYALPSKNKNPNNVFLPEQHEYMNVTTADGTQDQNSRTAHTQKTDDGCCSIPPTVVSNEDHHSDENRNSSNGLYVNIESPIAPNKDSSAIHGSTPEAPNTDVYANVVDTDAGVPVRDFNDN